MGVRGLTSYIENNCIEVLVKENLQKLIENYKGENKTAKAEILMNIQSIVKVYDGHKLSWICGGQMKQIFNITVDFAEKLKEIGAKLIFFGVGMSSTSRRKVILEERVTSRTKNIASGFDTLKKFEEIQNKVLLEENHDFMCADSHHIFRFILKDMCNCEVRYTSKEVDEEIANYARANNSFAILGYDSDFIICNAAKHYLSLKHLDLSTMTTMRYDSQALANHLQIHVKSLPLFATLLGNDVIRRPELEVFQKHICSEMTRRYADHYPNGIIVNAVANYVRRFSPGKLTDNTLADIANFVFMDKEKAEKIKESIESYLPKPYEPEPDFSYDMVEDPDSLWGRTYARAWNLRSRHSFFRCVYVIMKRHHGKKMTPAMEDPRKKDLPTSDDALRPLRLQVYGALLLDYPTPDWDEPFAAALNDLADYGEVEIKPTPVFPPRGKKRQKQWTTMELCHLTNSLNKI